MPRDLRWWEVGFLTLAVGYFAFHLALAVAGVDPVEFVRYVGRALVPDLAGI